MMVLGRTLAVAVVAALVLAACPSRGWRPAPSTPPPALEAPVDVPVEAPPVVELRGPSLEEVRAYRGKLGGLRDADGRRIWGPALAGAPPEVRAAWLARLASEGVTHVPVGPFDYGDVYPGVTWSNPDWTRDPGAIRQLIDELRRTPTVRGHGLIPVIFTDGGGRTPGPRLAVLYPTLEVALRGIEREVIVVPCGWESYEWRPRECYDAAWEARRRFPQTILAWHSWVGRSNGASNDPYNPNNDDMWLDAPQPDGARYGAWTKFWDPSLSPFQMFLYQAEPPRTLSDVECGGLRPGVDRWSSDALRNEHDGRGWKFKEACWMNKTSDAIARVGAGICTDDYGHGGRCGPGGDRTFVLFELATFHWWWDRMEAHDPDLFTRMTTFGVSECRKYGIECGVGDGFPLPAAR